MINQEVQPVLWEYEPFQIYLGMASVTNYAQFIYVATGLVSADYLVYADPFCFFSTTIFP